MKHLFRFFPKYRKEFLLGPFFKLVEASFELCVPLVMRAIIDVGIAQSDKGYMIKMALLLVLLALLGLISSVTAQYFAAKASVGMVGGLKSDLFSHFQSLSYRELDTIGTPTMITRMTSDCNQVQSGLNLALRLLLRSPFVVFGAMIMALTVDVNASMPFVIVIPILLAVTFAVMLVSIPMYRKVQGKVDGLVGDLRENLTGVRVLRAFRREKEEIKEFDRRNSELKKEQNRVGAISALLNPVTYVIINFAVLFLIWRGALRVDAGKLTQGDVVALYNYMGQILVELIKLANLIIQITKAIACANRIEKVFSVESSLSESENAPEETARGTVSFENVSFAYAGASDRSLSDITFSCEAGQTVGIIGGTGSGKTSLVSLIPRFYDVTEGKVKVNGNDVKDYPSDVLRRKFGVVPQQPTLFAGTIRENLLWGDENADEETLKEAIDAAQAADIVRSKEMGLDEGVEQGGRNFSGGQKQRLTIARALVRRPEFLILDDSASALDFATDASLRKALRALLYHPTVFIVSQRTSSVRYADVIVVLDEGKAVGIGTHDELLASCPVYREIHESQFRKEGASV